MFSAHFFNFYSQRPKNWDLKKILKKWFNFSPWFFFSLLALSFSSNRQCSMVSFDGIFTIKNQYVKNAVFIICASSFSPCLRLKNIWCWGQKGYQHALEGQGPPEVHYKTAGHVRGKPWQEFDLCQGQCCRSHCCAKKRSGHPTKLSAACWLRSLRRMGGLPSNWVYTYVTRYDE